MLVQKSPNPPISAQNPSYFLSLTQQFFPRDETINSITITSQNCITENNELNYQKKKKKMKKEPLLSSIKFKPDKLIQNARKQEAKLRRCSRKQKKKRYSAPENFKRQNSSLC